MFNIVCHQDSANQKQSEKSHHTHTIAKIKKTQTSVGKVERLQTPIHWQWDYKMRQLLWKSWLVSPNMKHRVTIWFSSSTLGSTPKRNENICPDRSLYACAWMFTAACLVITTKWKLSKCVSANDWINKTLSILMFNYLAIKKEESTDTCYNINEP